MASYFDRKPSSSARPALSHLQPDPSSPHTPPRQFSSTFSSPSVSYRAEEDAIIFELGNRHLSAGFAGESCPRCKLGFGPEESRRAGDYRRWLPGHNERTRKRRRLCAWETDHELWQMDLRGFDLGIVEDKIERAIREAYNKYLLLDSKARKVYLILPSILPHQLLNRVLHTLFENFQMPSVTLLSPSILATVAAGCRSGLVVDIGWRETIITAVYDYRDVSQNRTVRGIKMATSSMARLLEHHEEERTRHPAWGEISEEDGSGDLSVSVDLAQAEEVMTRMAWCRQRPIKPREHSSGDVSSYDIRYLGMEEERFEEDVNTSPHINNTDPKSIPSPFFPRQSIQVPFSAYAVVVEDTLLAKPNNLWDVDDHEQPLPQLIFKLMVSLPPDVRSVCMSRIMVTGGGSNIPGLKSRIIDEVAAMVQERGWDPVYGKAAVERRRRLREINEERHRRELSKPDDHDTIPNVPASLAPEVYHEIDEKLRREQEKCSQPTVSGVVRGVETLGAWAGGSLLASLRIKGIVDIEKDAFLQHGLAGAKRESDVSALPQRKSYGADISRAGIGERTSWTLGAWA
ncbi:MAG: hypothetical protein Q9217_000731 [Psora testacea]